MLPVRMRTVSLFEGGDSDDSVSLRKRLDGDVDVVPLTALGP